MTTSTRHLLFSKDGLADFWRRHRADFRSSPSAGVDGVTFKDFDARIDGEIAALAAEIASRTYFQQRLKVSFIRKDQSRFRCINVPTIRDRFVQRVLLEHLRKHYRNKLSEFPAFGVMRGQGTAPAIHQAWKFTSGYRWVTRVDIASFFDKVPRELAAKKVKATFPARSLTDLLVAPIYSETRLSSPEQRRLFRECGLIQNLGLRQGQPLSPLFAYIYLQPLDAYAKKRRWPYVRYVDDVVIFSQTRQEAEFRLAECKQLLTGLSIELSDKPEKNFVRGTHERFTFLGVDLLQRSAGVAAKLLPKGLQQGIKQDLEERVETLLTQKRPGSFTRLCNHVAEMRDAYRPAYGACEDWHSLENELPALAKGVMRRAVKTIGDGLDRGTTDKAQELAVFWALGIRRN